MPLNPNQINQDIPGVANAVSEVPATGPGKGTWYAKTVSGVVEFFYKDDQSREIQLTINGSPVGGVGGSGSTWLNGSGVPSSGTGSDGDYYLDNDNGDYYSKEAGSWSLLGNLTGPQGPQGIQGVQGLTGADGADGADGIFSEIANQSEAEAGANNTKGMTPLRVKQAIDALSPAGSGEANTGSNLGTGEGQVFAAKSGVDFQHRTIKAGTNVTVSQDANEITISSTGGGGGSVAVENDGSSVDAAMSTLDIQGEGAEAIQESAGNVAVHSREYKFTLPAAASLTSRIAGVTGLPSGFTLSTADVAGEDNLGLEADTLVVLHGLTGKIAVEARVFEVRNSGPAATQRVGEVIGVLTSNDAVRSTVTGNAVGFINLTSAFATDTSKDLVVYIKLI